MVSRVFRLVRLRWAVALGLIALAVYGWHISLGEEKSGQPFRADLSGSSTVPWTAVPHAEKSAFHFVIFGDRTGMAYPGALEVALEHVNARLHPQPSFVISVGDNIEGYSRDAVATNAMWADFDSAISSGLHLPFFRLPGNHDISDTVMEQVYERRYGRPYYAFEIASVLFLAMDTEDGPPVLSAEREAEIHRLLAKTTAEGALHPDRQVELPGQKNPCDAEATHADLGPLADTHISNAQLEYFRRVLAKHSDAKQIVVLMHRPAWRKPVSPEFARMQQMLHGRRYTVFAGHYHEYSHERVDGADYYILGPTAALPRCIKDARYLNQLLEIHVQGDRLSVERVMLPIPHNMPAKTRAEGDTQ